MRNIGLLSLSLIMLLVFSGISSITAGAEEKTLSGKDFVNLGKQGTVSGSLFEQAGEWYVKDQFRMYSMRDLYG